MPEVAIFDSPEVNAFATGMTKNSSLVAVSTGLLRGMTQDEVEAVLAHEVSHIANGDMVTLTLIQGVVNTFVMFFSRIIGNIVDKAVFKTKNGNGPAFFITMIIAEMVRILKKDEEEKQAIILKSFELATTITDGAFGLYQANLNNEMTLLNKRYEEEVRLADGNKQRLSEIEAEKAAKEKEIRTKQFQAEQAAAVARVIFETASQVAKWASNPVTAPLAALTLAVQAAQIGFILAQPVPEFAEGTKGKAFKGGKAMVGERGVEKVVTESGKVYFTPPTATLVDLPKGSQVIPNHALSKQEIYWGSMQSGKQAVSGSPMIGKLDELGSILKGLPITQLNMDERGFEKFIRTPRRTTKILNNRFRTDN